MSRPHLRAPVRYQSLKNLFLSPEITRLRHKPGPLGDLLKSITDLPDDGSKSYADFLVETLNGSGKSSGRHDPETLRQVSIQLSTRLERIRGTFRKQLKVLVKKDPEIQNDLVRKDELLDSLAQHNLSGWQPNYMRFGSPIPRTNFPMEKAKSHEARIVELSEVGNDPSIVSGEDGGLSALERKIIKKRTESPRDGFAASNLEPEERIVLERHSPVLLENLSLLERAFRATQGKSERPVVPHDVVYFKLSPALSVKLPKSGGEAIFSQVAMHLESGGFDDTGLMNATRTEFMLIGEASGAKKGLKFSVLTSDLLAAKTNPAGVPVVPGYSMRAYSGDVKFVFKPYKGENDLGAYTFDGELSTSAIGPVRIDRNNLLTIFGRQFQLKLSSE